MDKVSPRSVLDVPVQLSDDGSVSVNDSEHWDHLRYDADGTGWQGRSISNSISGTELRTPPSSVGPRRTSTTKGGAVIGFGAPPPPPHALICARRRAATDGAAAAAAAAADDDEDGFSDQGEDDDEAFSTDAQLALALRAVYARHRHDHTITKLGSAEHVIKTTIAMIKHEEAEAETARGHHTDDKMTTPDFDDSAHGGLGVDVARGLGVPRDGGVRVTGVARAGSVIVEAAAAFVSSLIDPAKLLVDKSRFESCAEACVQAEEPTTVAAAAEAAPVEAPAEPAPSPAPAMADYIPVRTIGVVFHDNDDNGHPEEEIEGCNGGGPRYYPVADDDGDLDDEEKKAVRQDLCVAPWDSSGASEAAASVTVGLRQYRRMIGDNFHAEYYHCTGALTSRDESLWPPAPDGASATGCTYDDITKSPPPHLRCVVSPLSSLPPVLR